MQILDTDRRLTVNNISCRDHISNNSPGDSERNPTVKTGTGMSTTMAWPSAADPDSDLVQCFCLWELQPGRKRMTYRKYIARVFSQQHLPTDTEM